MATEVQAKEIRSITMHRVVDTDPDLSYLGSYSNSPGEHAIPTYGPEVGDSANCNWCGEEIRADDNGVGGIVWCHHFGSTVCNDYPVGSVEDGDTAEPDDDYRPRGYDSSKYRYFNPVWQNYAGESPEDIARYVRADFERMESYGNDGWGMVGVYAQAEIVVAGTIQEVHSGGLYGIESDSDESYFAEIEKEELSALVTILEELGFERTAIDEACADVVDASD